MEATPQVKVVSLLPPQRLAIKMVSVRRIDQDTLAMRILTVVVEAVVVAMPIISTLALVMGCLEAIKVTKASVIERLERGRPPTRSSSSSHTHQGERRAQVVPSETPMSSCPRAPTTSFEKEQRRPLMASKKILTILPSSMKRTRKIKTTKMRRKMQSSSSSKPRYSQLLQGSISELVVVNKQMPASWTPA